jgi:hypothetical protein
LSLVSGERGRSQLGPGLAPGLFGGRRRGDGDLSAAGRDGSAKAASRRELCEILFSAGFILPPSLTAWRRMGYRPVTAARVTNKPMSTPPPESCKDSSHELVQARRTVRPPRLSPWRSERDFNPRGPGIDRAKGTRGLYLRGSGPLGRSESGSAFGGANKRLAKPAHGFLLAAFLCKCRSELQGHHQIYEPSTRAGFSGGHHCNVAKHLAFVWCALMQRPECATLRAMGGVIHD